MTVAVFVTSKSDAACLIPWGVHFAQADQTNLLVVCPRKSKGKRAWDPLELSEQDANPLFQSVFEILDQQDSERVVLKAAIAAGKESTDLNRTVIETRELIAPNPEEAFVEDVSGLDIRTLLLPAHRPIKGLNPEAMKWSQKLFATAPCEVAIVNGIPPKGGTPIRVLVASSDDTDSDSVLALSKGCQIAVAEEGGAITLLFVRPDDDLVAKQIAEKHLRQLEKRVSDKKIEINTKIELADSIFEGIRRLPLDQYDLLIVGTRQQRLIRSLFKNIRQQENAGKVSVAVVRAAVPLRDQIWSRFTAAVRNKVPQLDREQRVSLVDRLLDNSQFNFDFVALISLSTLIAALGLVRNSGAVVIGAMLVAPLMIPLLGMGFALVQGNVRLIQSALKSVLLGFTVALAISMFVGLILTLLAPHFQISSQMLDRGAPNLLDLVIAFASGVAGAYAMGRPNLLSALPGVAIAAALVPPIATSGLALTMGDLTLSSGALMLFFTNIIAIVLGTAITFWSVGISLRTQGNRAAQIWPRYLFLAFVIISFLLAIEMSYLNPLDPIPVAPTKGNTVEALTDSE